MEIKAGVYGHIHGKLIPVAAEYEWWRRSNGYSEGTITALVDGKHSRRSWHYEGRAIDLRTNDMSSDDASRMVVWLKSVFNDEYDIILHSTHLHVEFEGRWEV